MRLVCLSDTHCLHDRIKVSEGDVFVHAGDFCGAGTESEVRDFAAWLRSLPHRWKVVVAGNHDWFFERQPDLARAYLEPEALYLQDSGCVIEGIRFWGSPWQPEFMDWAFNFPRGGEALRQKWNLIPADIDVLITHGPPYGVLDEVKPRATVWGMEAQGSGPLGCEVLAERLALVKPALHIFGHIHDGYGFIQHGPTACINACICDEAYVPRNAPFVVDFERGRKPVIRPSEGQEFPRR